MGRVFFAAHLRMPRPDDPLLSGWHAVNCLREWRGDTHWALVAAAGLDARRGVDPAQRVARLRARLAGPTRAAPTPDELEAGWASLSGRGLAADRDGDRPKGVALRQQHRGRHRPAHHAAVGAARRGAVASSSPSRFEPPCELLLARVDETAGPNYQPASRLR